MTGAYAALASVMVLLSCIVAGAVPTATPDLDAVVAEANTKSSTIQALTHLDKLLESSPKDIVKMPPSAELRKGINVPEMPKTVATSKADAQLTADKENFGSENGYEQPFKMDCSNAPDQSSAVILQILFGFFGGGFIYLDRMDLAYMCMGVTFGPLLAACLTVFVQRGKKESEGIEHDEPHRMVAAFWLLGGCCVGFLGCYFWSIGALANGDILCGGQYAGCFPVEN